MRRLAVLAFVCSLLVAAAPASAAAPPPADAATQVIGQGVDAGGVDVSGLTVVQAAAKIDAALRPHLTRAVVVRVGARSFRLDPSAAGFVFDSLITAKRAYYAGRDRPPPAPRSDGGAVTGVSVALAVRHASQRVRAFADQTASRVTTRPRNARLRMTVRRMVLLRARHGRTIDSGSLANVIDRALDDAAASRQLRARFYRTTPAVTVEGLRRANPTVLTIDRSNFTLRLFKRLKFVKRYGIAVGQAGLETPPGRYRVQDRQVNPVWHVPNRTWAGSLAGQTIPGGLPSNPLKARWLGLADGVGIHGTAEDWSIGTAASHGCIRMHVADVIDLYGRVPVGAPVLIR